MILLSAALAVVLLVILIARFRMNAFIALLLASIAAGLGAGLPLTRIARAFQDGVGGTLGFITIVIGLGTILGKLLAESGGAAVVSDRLVRLFGERRLPWAVVLIAFIVGLPVFFNVGLVLLAPIVFTLARTTGTPIMGLAIPLVAGLSAAHGLVPPHPGPLAAIERLGADTGLVLFYSLIVGLPCAIVAGPLFAWLLGDRVRPAPGGLAAQLSGGGGAQDRPGAGRRSSPGFTSTMTLILLPVLLMLAGTLVTTRMADGSIVREWVAFAGTPLVALLLSTLIAWRVFGTARGFDRATLLRFSEDCVGPIANVLLVVGAGGGFGRVLDEAGVGRGVADAAQGLAISPLLLGWTIAALLRIAVGSATVAITTTAGIVAPMVAGASGTDAALLVLAMGAGSLIASHVNDGGFWLVKEYFNLTVPETLRSWTVLETIIAVVALLLVLLLSVLT
ncbi:MAG TPA: gluconate:H+ symporter [Vicinamibacterales bacterium]